MKRLFFIIGISSFFLSTYAQEESVTMDFGSLNLSEEQNRKIESAFIMMDAVQKAGNYIESLSDLLTNGKAKLPVGVKKGGYELIVQGIQYDRETQLSTIHATCAFRFKDTGQKIAFEGEAVLTGRNGLVTAGRLVLIAPVRRNIGRSSALDVLEGTAVDFGCEGIESFDAKLAWMVTSDKIIPVDSQGNPTNRPLRVLFETRFNDFDNYLISLNVNQSFTISGLNDILFTLKGATLDQSDTETSSMTHFPENYFPQGDAAAVPLWKGLAVSEASLSLPSFFKKTNSANDERDHPCI
jgi:hypothetical protein